VKLTEAHLKLKMKNGPYNLARKRCASCRYSCTTSNVLQLHREFGNNKRDDVHICCVCDFRTRFPSQFIVHVETVHSMTGRLAKRLSVIICPYCPFENKRGDKVLIHWDLLGLYLHILTYNYCLDDFELYYVSRVGLVIIFIHFSYFILFSSI